MTFFLGFSLSPSVNLRQMFFSAPECSRTVEDGHRRRVPGIIYMRRLHNPHSEQYIGCTGYIIGVLAQHKASLSLIIYEMTRYICRMS